MGATAFFHPDSWLQLAGELRSRIGGGAGDGSVHIGVGINNAKLCGGCLPSPPATQAHVTPLPNPTQPNPTPPTHPSARPPQAPSWGAS